METGGPSENGPAFAAGDLASLRRDNASDPTLPTFDGTLTQPLLTYNDKFFSGRCGKTPPNADFSYVETDRPAQGPVTAIGKTSGIVTQLTASAGNFYDTWYNAGSNLLITLRGVVSSGGGTSFSGTISSDGSTFNAMAGSDWLDWNSFAIGLTVLVSRTVSGVTTVYKTLTTAADKTAGTVTVQGLDGFTFTGGDAWKIEVCKYELNRLQQRRAAVAVAAYTGHAARTVIVHVVANDQQTAFIEPADALSISDDDLAAGITLAILTFESGSVLQRDPTNSFWQLPTGTDNREDPNNDNVKPKFKIVPQNNQPFVFHAYGPMVPGDYWRPELFNQIAAVNRTIKESLMDWTYAALLDGDPDNFRSGVSPAIPDETGPMDLGTMIAGVGGTDYCISTGLTGVPGPDHVWVIPFMGNGGTFTGTACVGGEDEYDSSLSRAPGEPAGLQQTLEAEAVCSIDGSGDGQETTGGDCAYTVIKAQRKGQVTLATCLDCEVDFYSYGGLGSQTTETVTTTTSGQVFESSCPDPPGGDLITVSSFNSGGDPIAFHSYTVWSTLSVPANGSVSTTYSTSDWLGDVSTAPSPPSTPTLGLNNRIEGIYGWENQKFVAIARWSRSFV
jgi:hypothetical protein